MSRRAKIVLVLVTVVVLWKVTSVDNAPEIEYEAEL